MTLWLDCSSSYSVVPTPQQVADLRALGFEGAIIGSVASDDDDPRRTKAARQIAVYRAGGMRVEEYQFPSAVRPLGAPWWIDAELDDATLASLRQALRNGSCGPYTRRGWALDNLPGWNCKAEFPDAELWDARYVHGDNDGCRIRDAVEDGDDIAAAIDLERSWVSPFKPYWGFERAKVTQWHNSITICGVNMDLNEYMEDDMTPVFVAWVIGWGVFFVGPGGAHYIPKQSTVDELAALYQISPQPSVGMSPDAARALGGQ